MSVTTVAPVAPAMLFGIGDAVIYYGSLDEFYGERAYVVGVHAGRYDLSFVGEDCGAATRVRPESVGKDL